MNDRIKAVNMRRKLHVTLENRLAAAQLQDTVWLETWVDWATMDLIARFSMMFTDYPLRVAELPRWANWLEAVKDRFLPRWARKFWPIKYEQVPIDIHVHMPPGLDPHVYDGLWISLSEGTE